MTPERSTAAAARLAIGLLGLLAAASAVHPPYELLAVAVRNSAVWGHQWFRQDVLYSVMRALAALTAAGLAVWTAWRAGRDPGSRVFALFLALFATVAADEGSFQLARAVLGVGPAIAPMLAEIVHAIAFGFCLAAGLRWAQRFPSDAPLSYDIAPAGSRPRAAALAAVASARFAWLGVGIGTTLLLVIGASLGDRILVQIACASFVLAFATWILRRRYISLEPAASRRMFWVMQAALTASVLVFASLPVEAAVHGFGAGSAPVRWLHVSLLPLALLTFVTFLAVAVLYDGALDPVLVVRRTVAYTAVGAALTTLFVAVETVASAVVEAWLGLPDAAASLLAGLVAAFAFGPVKERVDRALHARRSADMTAPPA